MIDQDMKASCQNNFFGKFNQNEMKRPILKKTLSSTKQCAQAYPISVKKEEVVVREPINHLLIKELDAKNHHAKLQAVT